MSDKAPNRPYILFLKMGADSLDEIRSELKNLIFDLNLYDERIKKDKIIDSISGSPSSNYSLTLIKSETKDHEEYINKLTKYLDKEKENTCGGI